MWARPDGAEWLERLLAIDPKPLAGEVEFAVAPLCRDYTLGHSPSAVRHRLDRFCVAWAFDENKAIVRHVDTARWLID